MGRPNSTPSISAEAPPKYRPAVVEQVILEEALRLHPRNLTAAELCERIVADPKDRREVETATQAIRSLKEFYLVRECDDGSLEPTDTALHASRLLID
jgi:hypothetical protein